MKLNKKRIFEIIQVGERTDLASRMFDFALILLISLNLFMAVAETFHIPMWLQSTFDVLEPICCALFTVEYVLRVWTADYLHPDKSRAKATCAYVFSFMGAVDLLSLLPFYLPLIFPTGFIALRALRAIRILRLFKISPYYDALAVIGHVLHEKKSQLYSSVFILVTLMLTSALLMYHVEHAAQPEVFQNAFSGIWWSMSTIATIGYGDIYPITLLGRFLSIFIAFLGIGIVAIPTGIISAGFVEQVSAVTNHANGADTPLYCPHCGKKLTD